MSKQLDYQNLLDYLSDKLEVSKEALEISQFKGGFSNLTFQIQSPKKSWVLRRPPFGEKISKAHDMGREFSVLKALETAGYSKIPKAILFEESSEIFGAPFFLMEHVEGLILRNKSPELVQFTAGNFESLSKGAIDALLDLHSLELEQSGLVDLGKPEGYVARQVEGWSKRYFKAKTKELPELEESITWLNANLPSLENVGFIHNDFKYDNMVLDSAAPFEIKAILDWEMATVGDPLMDLGTSLAYWAQKDDPDILKMFNLTHLQGNMTRLEVIEYYSSKSPLDLKNMLFYYIFGLIKVGVIAQQIFRRFCQGHTNDSRFGALIHVVEAAGRQAIHSINTQKI